MNKNILFAQSNTVLLNFSLNNYKLDRFNLPEENAAIISGIGFNLGFAYEKPICKKSSILLGFEFSKRKMTIPLALETIILTIIIFPFH
ncbi:MAG: hypothetical protein IPN15_20430 [Saprospiraceae bacterium]|nr:hypothetical protein [Candidatus Vicinibacter affinis]